MEEYYVDFEMAKLLKQRGFNEFCEKYYSQEGKLMNNNNSYSNKDMESESFVALAPLKAVVLNWFRKKGVCIVVAPEQDEANDIIVYRAVVYDTSNSPQYRFGGESLGLHYSYEDAENCAIKECLEISILDKHLCYLLGKEGVAMSKKTGKVFIVTKRKNHD